jgi:hypothetical protein
MSIQTVLVMFHLLAWLISFKILQIVSYSVTV